MAKDSDANQERELTLVGHLDELRTRLIISVGFLFVATLVSFFFARPVLEVLIRPATRASASTKVVVPVDGAEEEEGKELEPPDDTLTLIVGEDGSLSVDLDLIAGLKSVETLLLLLPSDDESTTRTLISIGGPEKGASMIYLSPLDPFMMPFKVSIIMGILLSLPVWVWQIWLFIAPGLTATERKVVRPLLAAAIFLFPLGAGFAYGMFYLIIPVMAKWAVEDVNTTYNIRDYLKIMTNMMIVFGFIFELPLVIALLARIGIVTPAFLRHYRRHIYIGLAFIAMIITPADPITMVVALLPLIGLFEISIYIAGVMTLMRARDEDDSDTPDPPDRPQPSATTST